MGKGTQRPNFQFLFFTDSNGGFKEKTSVENCLKNIEASQITAIFCDTHLHAYV